MNKLKQLEKFIVKSIPEIMKLESGCRVLIDDDEGGKIETKVIQRCKGNDNEVILEFLPSRNWKIKDIENIGRLITFEDVMIAIEDPSISFRYFYKDKLYIQIEKGGKLLGIWELNIPLQNQNKELRELLRNLINNK